MNENLNKIVDKSIKLFFRYGIKSVSMMDLARELGMSKKTLYQYIENKADLVKQGVALHLKKSEDMCLNVIEPEKNAIEEMLDIGNQVYLQLATVNLVMMYDLRKYYPETWELLKQHREKFIFSVIQTNIKKGVKQGVYRSNINAEIIARLYLAKTVASIEDEYFAQIHLRPSDLFLEAFKYHIYGIASEEGIHFLKNNINKYKNKKYV